MPVALLIGAGVFGLLIGSFLNVVIWRVPRGESVLPGSRCPGCGEAIRPQHNVPVISWLVLRGRCARCREPISARYPLIEAATAIAFALVAWWFTSAYDTAALLGAAGVLPALAAWLALAGYLWFAAAGIALTAIDLELKRLPDPIVLPSLGVVTALLIGSAALTGDWGRVITVLAAAVALFVFYFVIVLVYPAGMGGGDVKLAPLIGAITGYAGWPAVAVGAFSGFLLGAIAGLLVVALRRSGLKHAIPFGPWMLAGAWIGIVWGDALMAAYLGLVGLA